MGVYRLELVGKEGVDEGVEIARESHQRPNCLAKSFLMPGNAVAQTTWGKLAACTALERGGGLEWEKGAIRQKLTGTVCQAGESWNGGSPL